MNSNNENLRKATADHRRQWRDLGFVYPVVSRRAGGLSIGVNLNTDKVCNFSCLYCQVDRRLERLTPELTWDGLQTELESVLDEVDSGQLWQTDRFKNIPNQLRRINDIAFSGDGEPTSLPEFDKAMQAASDALESRGLTGKVKLIVITNSTCLDSEQFARALPILDKNASEIWAKLDAGTDEYYQLVNLPVLNQTLDQICENILSVAKLRPVILQTLFMKIDNHAPSDSELNAYCDRVNRLLKAGAQIDYIQLHTIARPPAAGNVRALSNDQIDQIASMLRANIPNVRVCAYYGQDVEPQ